MRTLLRMLVVGTVLAVGGASVALAATAADPAVGSWKLNVEKSKFSASGALKSETRTYVQTDDGLKLTFTGVAADGSTVSGESTYKYDGKDYPISGSNDYDALAVTRVNSHTATSVQKKAGKKVGTTTRTVSKDGMTMTLTHKGKNAKGEVDNSTLVFDKQ
jgi:hypothetical protein